MDLWVHKVDMLFMEAFNLGTRVQMCSIRRLKGFGRLLVESRLHCVSPLSTALWRNRFRLQATVGILLLYRCSLPKPALKLSQLCHLSTVNSRRSAALHTLQVIFFLFLLFSSVGHLAL